MSSGVLFLERASGGWCHMILLRSGGGLLLMVLMSLAHAAGWLVFKLFILIAMLDLLLEVEVLRERAVVTVGDSVTILAVTVESLLMT